MYSHCLIQEGNDFLSCSLLYPQYWLALVEIISAALDCEALCAQHVLESWVLAPFSACDSGLCCFSQHRPALPPPSMSASLLCPEDRKPAEASVGQRYT